MVQFELVNEIWNLLLSIFIDDYFSYAVIHGLFQVNWARIKGRLTLKLQL